MSNIWLIKLKFATKFNVWVNTKTPKIINKIPTIILKYLINGPSFFINDIACVENSPTNKNGSPNPSEYVNNKIKLKPGLDIANAKTDPNTAPTQGVHPTANAAPNTNDVI